MVSMDVVTSYRGPDLKLFVRDVHDRQGKKRPVTVRSWSTIKDVKDTLQQIIHVPSSSQRLYFGPLLTSGGELPNHRSLHDAGIYRSGETLLLDIMGGRGLQSPGGGALNESSLFSLRYTNDVCVSSSMFDSTPKVLRNLVQRARGGFAVGLKPEFVLDGSGGTYFLHDSRKNKIAVFKPADEEPYAENNPRNYIQQADQSLSLREGIVPGQACIREVAAHLLDHDGFSSVPMTTLAEARHPTFHTNGSRLTVAEGGASIGSHSITSSNSPTSASQKKAGSFQEFVQCECTMDDISPSKLSVEEVHKIAILDIRIMNADRNAANLLVRRREDDSLELVPIDHGFCLRSVCDVSWMDWCWLDWSQMKKPLSDKHKEYIENLDIEADAQMLQDRLNIGQEAIDYFRASSTLLKAGVKAGLTLYDIAILCCRNDNEARVPSLMEKLFSTASELAHAAVENERWHHTAASRAIAEQLSPAGRAAVEYKKSNSMCSDGSFRKSASSLGLKSLDMAESYLSHSLLGRESPGMAQSSVSDSSSNVDEEEASDIGEEDVLETPVSGDAPGGAEECCDEWAAGIVAEMNMDEFTLPRRNGRSSSIGSDDGSCDSSYLSSSPKGFWTVRPGSYIPSCPSDDGSAVSWSPQLSPRNSVELAPPELGSAVPPPGLAREEAPVPPQPVVKTPTVTFACEPTSFIPPATVNVATFKTGELEKALSLSRQESASGGGMTRSKSLSAFPAGTSKHRRVASSASRAGGHRKSPTNSEEHENYRMYFHKFIDLVIVRETTAALGLARAESC